MDTRSHQTTSRNEDAPPLRRYQGRYIINHAPASRRADAERDVMYNVRMICPDWDILDLIFSDRDGGSIALRSDCTQANNLVLQALEDEPFNSLQSQLPASTGPFGFTQTSPTLLLQV
nr:hypothetical protein L204_05063 [Cryptococcus depauperatus CBS 7855]